MDSKIKSCYIYSDDDSLPAIFLPDEIPVIVGRSVETKITDVKCSRNQVRLYASYANERVFVQQVGSKSCGLNGFRTERGVKLVARHGDRLELLYGLYPYRIEFNPVPSDRLSEGTVGKKRICSGSDNENQENSQRRSLKKQKGSSGQLRSLSNNKNSEETAETEEGIMDDFVEEGIASDILNTVQDRAKTCEEAEGSTSSKEIDLPSKVTEDSWEEFETLMIYTPAGVQSRPKIAAYDMDNTLIKTMSGGAFPKDHNDWQILYPDVPGKLKKLHSEGYKIVIFTNQGGMFMGKIKPADFKTKIQRVVKRLGVPIQVFIATGKDIYRKPRPGMWKKLINDKNDGLPIEKSKCFFVGDAAGRAKDWAPKKKKDHSLADRLFGLNVALNFYTPEEHFLGQKPAPYKLPEFDPKKLSKNESLSDRSDENLTSSKQEVIIMVGGPASGKTHVAKTYLKDYHHVNRDKLGSWQKCVSAMENALSRGESVVIDNTNPDVPSRQRFIEAAKAQGVQVRCFVMTTQKEHAKHNNKFRELTDPSHATISDVIMNMYSYTNSTLLWRCTRFVKLLLLMFFRLLAGTLFFTHVQPYREKYVAPNIDEGFTEIVKINFVPTFENDEHRKLYEMYLVER